MDAYDIFRNSEDRNPDLRADEDRHEWLKRHRCPQTRIMVIPDPNLSLYDLCCDKCFEMVHKHDRCLIICEHARLPRAVEAA